MALINCPQCEKEVSDKTLSVLIALLLSINLKEELQGLCLNLYL